MNNRKIAKILFFLSIFSLVISGLIKRGFNEKNYQSALSSIHNADYESALSFLSGLEDYKDANFLKKEAQNGKQYESAAKFMDKKEYKEAIKKLDKIIKNSSDKNLVKKSETLIVEAKYHLAIEYYKKGKYDESLKLFNGLGDYKDTKYYIDNLNREKRAELTKTIYDRACELFRQAQYKEALENFNSILDYKDSREKIKECENQIRRRNLNNTISGGIRHSVAIFENGKATAVGDNDRCNLTKFNDMISIDACGCLTIGLKKNKKVIVAGTYDEGLKIDTNKNKWKNNKFIDIAAGERFVVGLTKNGTVVGDGHNDDNQISFKGWEKEKFIAIDAGWRFTVGLTKNKELKFSGLYGDQLKDFKKHKDEWKDVVNISAAGGDTTSKKRGSGHTVGLKSDGTVVAVGGDSKWKQCDVKEWKNIIKVVAGDWYTVGLKNNGQVLITGENESKTEYIKTDKLEQINKKADVVDIAAGYGQTIFLHKDGSVSAFNFDDDQKTNKILKWRNLKMP